MSMSAAEFRERQYAAMSEAEWQASLIKSAKELGYKAYHTYRSVKSERGFPDLVLVGRRVLFIECKTQKGKATDAQRDWLHALKAAGELGYVWRPSDQDEAMEVLALYRPRGAA